MKLSFNKLKRHGVQTLVALTLAVMPVAPAYGYGAGGMFSKNSRPECINYPVGERHDQYDPPACSQPQGQTRHVCHDHMCPHLQGNTANGSYCYDLAYPVKKADITLYDRVVMNISIRYSPSCNAYFGQMDSFNVERNMQVSLRRMDKDFITMSGYQNAFTVRSAMVPKGRVEVHGCYLSPGQQCYSLSI